MAQLRLHRPEARRLGCGFLLIILMKKILELPGHTGVRASSACSWASASALPVPLCVFTAWVVLQGLQGSWSSCVSVRACAYALPCTGSQGSPTC